MAEGVSLRFFTEAGKSLVSIHGNRLMNGDAPERLRAALAEAEAIFKALPEADEKPESPMGFQTPQRPEE